jgi:hypothetical protein
VTSHYVRDEHDFATHVPTSKISVKSLRMRALDRTGGADGWSGIVAERHPIALGCRTGDQQRPLDDV